METAAPGTDRVTRSRARTLASTGATPSLAAGLPDKTPATRTTRRRAAAAAEPSVAPAVLFDMTNDQEPASPPAAPVSPAPVAPGATPTGLGLSSLLPMSPIMGMALPAKTPAATPLGGVAVGAASKVYDALNAAMQALGGGAAQPEEAAEEEGPVFRGFGSPLKPGPDSPDTTPVSICGAIGAAGASGAAAADSEEEADATSGPSPGLSLGGGAFFERELTLEEMMGTPFPSAKEPTPTFQPAAAAVAPAPVARATAAAGTTPVAVVRTAAKAHPLTPSRQVVLKEEEQDYIMHAEEAAAAELAAAELAEDDTDMASVGEPSPLPVAAAELAAAQPRLMSKVVVPIPGVYDPRSLRQLKKAVSDKIASKQAGATLAGLEQEGGEYEEEEYVEDYAFNTAGGDELAEELGGLNLERGTHGPLLGMPTPVGSHIRFADDGEVAEVSPRQRVFLRGLPEPAGTHTHFDD